MTEQEITNKIKRILDSLGKDSIKTLVITLDEATGRISSGTTMSDEELFEMMVPHVDDLSNLGKAAIGAVAFSENFKHAEMLRQEYREFEARRQAADLLANNQQAFNSKMNS